MMCTNNMVLIKNPRDAVLKILKVQCLKITQKVSKKCSSLCLRDNFEWFWNTMPKLDQNVWNIRGKGGHDFKDASEHFFTDRKEVHHSPKENQETLCFSILPPSEFFIEYIFVPVVNSKQYHVRQRIENLICQSELILHSLLMLESKKKICLALITIYHRPKLILHICVKVMIFHCKSCWK